MSEAPYIHVKRANYSAVWCAVNDCPTCDRPRRMLAQFEEWYGTRWTCAGCGDSWMDGERGERPFAPGWRRRAIECCRRELAKIGVQA